MNDQHPLASVNGLSRRSVLKAGVATALSLAGGGALPVALSAAPAPTRPPAAGNTSADFGKAWAGENLRGGESFILPSMTPDFKGVDEARLRREVRHSIAQGFCSIQPLPLGVRAEQRRLMNNVVADEARGNILLVGQSEHCSHSLLYFNDRLGTQDEMYEQVASSIAQTDRAIVLYARPRDATRRLDPTGLPLDAFDRLADLDQVVAVKFTQLLRPAAAYAVARRLGDRLLLGVVDLELMLTLSLEYPMQWTGQWAVDSLQSPEKPWVGQFLALLSEGRHDEAYRLYWEFEPAATAFYELQAPSLSIGGHPWLHIKYLKWLTGGNGGLLADLNESEAAMPHLDREGRAKCRQALESVGIETVGRPDESFAVGNAAYDRGVRASDLPALPQYIA